MKLNDIPTETLAAWDKRHNWHPFTPMADWCAPGHEPLVLVGGRGAWLRDSRGREYLDGNSSIWTNIHGHGHPRIVAAIREQVGRLDHASFLGFTNDVATRLARELALLLGEDTPLPRVFFSDDGATAVEVALRMAVQYWHQNGAPARKSFVAFDRAYHGDTLGSASLGGIGTFTPGVERLGYPVRPVADVKSFRALLEADPEAAGEIAGVIIEPLIQGAAGMRTWPAGMLRELRELCTRHDLFLILDEVMTGFGRTGTMFACQRESVIPDFLCLAKGLTGGTVPMAATLTTERVFEGFLQPGGTFYYGHSYTGNPIGAAAALASLEVFREENTLAALQPKIQELRALLEPLRAHPHVGDIRVCGFMAGIDLVNVQSPYTPYPLAELTGSRVCVAARKHGLLTRPIRDTITLIPPLCLTSAEIVQCIEAIHLAITEICGT